MRRAILAAAWLGSLPAVLSQTTVSIGFCPVPEDRAAGGGAGASADGGGNGGGAGGGDGDGDVPDSTTYVASPQLARQLDLYLPHQ